uniref:Uncharacterized protein n=1 Tax=Trypanosoma congolense (strain IL3000) TaxID=1068625 RepID=G0UIQ8_TRYCI|nr:conserved hypothetical protein [Trypanosoma congolense IL3000]
MGDSLVDKFIADVLRDPNAWKRAVACVDSRSRYSEKSGAIRSVAGPLFRRGTNENVSSLKFLDMLRRDDVEGVNARAVTVARTDVRQQWDNSKTIIDEQQDLLKQLLVRKLNRHGFFVSYQSSKAKLLEKHAREMSSRQQRYADIVVTRNIKVNSRQREHVIVKERNERQFVLEQERKARRTILRRFAKQSTVVVENEEFVERREIFRELLEVYCAIKAIMDEEMYLLTGIRPEDQHAFFAIQQMEAKERHEIIARFESQRREMFLQLQKRLKNTIQNEIKRIIRREQQIQELHRQCGYLKIKN